MGPIAAEVERRSTRISFDNTPPSKCKVVSGGFLFGLDGAESGQLDIIVTNDTALQF
jgi:hypothetical protein